MTAHQNLCRAAASAHRILEPAARAGARLGGLAFELGTTPSYFETAIAWQDEECAPELLTRGFSLYGVEVRRICALMARMDWMEERRSCGELAGAEWAEFVSSDVAAFNDLVIAGLDRVADGVKPPAGSDAMRLGRTFHDLHAAMTGRAKCGGFLREWIGDLIEGAAELAGLELIRCILVERGGAVIRLEEGAVVFDLPRTVLLDAGSGCSWPALAAGGAVDFRSYAAGYLALLLELAEQIARRLVMPGTVVPGRTREASRSKSPSAALRWIEELEAVLGEPWRESDAGVPACEERPAVPEAVAVG